MSLIPPEPILDRDYTVRTDGAWVFTREYLFARGTCCGSKCSNCPYVYDRAPLDRTKMRPVVSMVPSWTETLVNSSVNVVGRTRFCIHPHDAVKSIPSIGGTKTLSTEFDKIMTELSIRATESGRKILVILDREENPKEFVAAFSKYPCEIYASHVSDFVSLAKCIDSIADLIANPGDVSSVCDEDKKVATNLRAYAERAKCIQSSHSPAHLIHALMNSQNPHEEIENLLCESQASVLYFIWRRPWMIVNRGTWIEASLKACFPSVSLPSSESRYTEITENELEKEVSAGAVLFFSSEPYPFEKVWDEICRLPFVRKAHAVALVDGEAFSWFGIRSMRFLENAREPGKR